jgi:hypothetical protein
MLMDVKPPAKAPKRSLLEAIRQTIEHPTNLEKARNIWWSRLQMSCLNNKYWDPNLQEVVDRNRKGAVAIVSATFDQGRNSTVLVLQGEEDPMEILL